MPTRGLCCIRQTKEHQKAGSPFFTGGNITPCELVKQNKIQPHSIIDSKWSSSFIQCRHLRNNEHILASSKQSRGRHILEQPQPAMLHINEGIMYFSFALGAATLPV